jgi:hypothetical protein
MIAAKRRDFALARRQTIGADPFRRMKAKKTAGGWHHRPISPVSDEAAPWKAASLDPSWPGSGGQPGLELEIGDLLD